MWLAGTNAVVGRDPESAWALGIAAAMFAANAEAVTDEAGNANLPMARAELAAAQLFTLAVTCGAARANVPLDASAKEVEIVLK